MATSLKGYNASSLLYALFGGLALLAFEPVGLFPVAWVCLIPLLPNREPAPWHKRLVRGYCFGLAFYGVGLSWTPAGIVSFSDFALPAAWASFSLVLVFLALFPAAFQLLLGYFPGNRFRLLVVAPSLWVVLETMRFHAWGGLPWLNLATTQIAGPLSGLIPVIGGTGMNFLLVFLNGLLLLLAQGVWRSRLQRPTPEWILPLGLLLLIPLTSFLLRDVSWVEPQGSPLQVGMAQAGRWDAHEVSPSERKELVRSYRDLARQITPKSDMVILPESAIWHEWEEWSREFQEQTGKGTAYIVGAMEKTLGGDRYNSVFLFKDSGRARYRKQRLVPIGESRPPWIVAPFVGPVGETGNHVLPGRIQAPLQWQGTQFGPLVCWETRFPDLARDHVLAGADILVNPANESWLDSDVAKQRSLAVARMRAAETGRMLVRVANWGLSAVIGPKGEILTRLSGREPFAEVVQVKTYEGNTPYMALGLENSLRALSFLLLFLGAVTLGFVRKSSFAKGNSCARMHT